MWIKKQVRDDLTKCMSSLQYSTLTCRAGSEKHVTFYLDSHVLKLQKMARCMKQVRLNAVAKIQ